MGNYMLFAIQVTISSCSNQSCIARVTETSLMKTEYIWSLDLNIYHHKTSERFGGFRSKFQSLNLK